jgi:hypothetical protein
MLKNFLSCLLHEHSVFIHCQQTWRVYATSLQMVAHRYECPHIEYISIWIQFDIVTYSGVLFTMELYCTPKSEHTTVKHSQKLFEHTYTSNLYGLGTLNSNRILPTGPLVAVVQHKLTFLQSESLQTHVGTIHRRNIGPLAHHSSTSVYSPSLTCTSPDDWLSSPSTV